jgi:TRAP transporter TAXI family solute receptor
MLEKDEYGYVLKIVSNFPYHPWWRLTAQLVEGFRDKKKTGLVSSVGVYSPKFGLGSFENPKMIGRGEVDAGIINPPVTAKMAMEGKGPYQERVGELRAIARFPEPDYIFWLVAEELGVSSFEELARRKPPLILVSGRSGPTGPDTLTWTVEQVMKQYGFSYQDIESWGGKVLFPGPAVVGVPLVRDGQANAIFQEGVHHPMWEGLAETRPLLCLALKRSVVDYMKETYGFSEATIPKGRLKGIREDLLTLDYGGWLLTCREDLPEELAYLLARVSTDQRDAIAAPYKDQPTHLQSFEIPITPRHLCTKCVIPLHKGAEKYYREIGCL